ncbi:MAG: tetratricopeptide repeat protein [Bacteroidota bacterium]|nr:tetratricopeptide repeat protein [Bacteroidota bacterium]
MIFYFCHLALPAQNKNIDSLFTLQKTDKPDSNKVNHSLSLGREFIKIGLYDTALYYCNSALQLAQQLNFKNGIASSYSIIGTVFYYQGDYSSTLDYYFKALKINEELNNKKEIVKQLSNIGLVFYKQGNYRKALDNYFKSVKIAEELDNKSSLANTLSNIGLVYRSQGDYTKALNYYFKALKISKELGNVDITAYLLGNIGNVYKEQKDYFKALDNYLEVLKTTEGLENKNLIATALGNIGTVYAYQRDYTKATDYFFKALKIAEELGNKDGIALNLSNIGKVYTSIGKFKEAEQYLKRANALYDSIGNMNDLLQMEIYLSQLYDTTGRGKEALIHYKKAITIKDTLFSQENKKELVRKEMQYDFDKKEAAAKAQQEKKDAVTVEEKQRQKVIIYSISVGLFLVLLLAFFIFRGYRLKQKANIIITQQKAEVENQKELVEIKNKEITDSITYARRIQQAKLPKKEEIYAALARSFILFKPKDIVSGDFYFFHKNERIVFIASADCTGHGVPGAFMSMIGSEKLEDAVSQTTDTSEILKLLNNGIKTALHQSENDESTRDGMDIALCSIDTENRIVKYAGANRPIWIIRKGQTQVEETKATKKAIGGFTEDKQHFDTHELKLRQGDTFYIFTDGYADQFGGEDGKKLMTKKFKEILLDIQDKTMQEQEKYLNTFVDNWRGKREQIDDILVIGIRL